MLPHDRTVSCQWVGEQYLTGSAGNQELCFSVLFRKGWNFLLLPRARPASTAGQEERAGSSLGQNLVVPGLVGGILRNSCQPCGRVAFFTSRTYTWCVPTSPHTAQRTCVHGSVCSHLGVHGVP